jgi:hypothetical protein
LYKFWFLVCLILWSFFSKAFFIAFKPDPVIDSI